MAAPPRAATASQGLAAYVAALRFADLPAEAVTRAGYLLLDTLGVALSNVGDLSAVRVRALADALGGAPVARIWGTGARTSVPLAALANGLASHLSDFDDTHAEGGLHAGATVVPAVLAVADARRLDGRELLTAVVAGYEVACRLGAAAPHVFTQRRWHATSACGAVAAAAAAGQALGLSAEQLAHAIGIAASTASGTLQPLEEGSPVKALHPGWAAHAGTTAALLAERGFPGPAAALDGRQGFFAAFAGDGAWDPDRLVRGLGTEWEVLRVISKPYPCCHFLHAVVDAAIEFRAEHDSATVVGVTCLLPQQARDVVCEPWALKLAPASPYAARFSLPFVITAALTTGSLEAELFTPGALPRVLAHPLLGAVSYQLDDDPLLARTYGGELVVALAGGGEWRGRVTHPRGSAARPLTPAELEAKFRTAAGVTLGVAGADALLHQIADLAGPSPVAGLSLSVPSTEEAP
jgi:2-methylcitrate dehydratase PrpD